MKTYLKFGNLEASNGKIYPNLKYIKKKKSSGKEVNWEKKKKKRKDHLEKKNHSSFNVNQ